MDPKFEFLLKLRVFVLVAAQRGSSRGAPDERLVTGRGHLDLGSGYGDPDRADLRSSAREVNGRPQSLGFRRNPARVGSGDVSVHSLCHASGRDRTRQCQRHQAPKCTASVKAKTGASAFQAERWMLCGPPGLIFTGSIQSKVIVGL